MSTEDDSGDLIEVGAVLACRYEVVRRIQRGAFATVYEARDRRLGTTCALKVLHAKHARDGELLVRFRMEGQIQAELVHPGIIRVFDAISEPRALVMEIAEGGDLAQWLGGAPVRPEISDALRIVHPILDALEAAHAKGVIHRDLKPSNVVFSFDPEGRLIPRLTDFGIAKIADGAAFGHDSPRTTSVRIGTIEYMSPEQYHARELDARSDLFSLGAILYELLSKRRPFKDAESLLRGELVPLEDLVPEIGGALADCVRTALAPEPSRRFQSCAEFRRALLDAVEATEPPRVGSMPLEPAPEDPIVPDPSASAWTAAALGVLGLVGIGGAGQIYNRQLAKGALLFAAHGAALLACAQATWTWIPWLTLASTAVGAVDAWRIARRRRTDSIERWTWF